jgi:DNA topoisomerase-1
MNLFIVESPTKAKNISAYLKELYPNEKFIVKATAGHFKNLVKDELGLEKDSNGKIKGVWKIDDGKHKLVKELKDFASKSSMIYIATDPDREGEKIASDLVEELKPKQYKRVYLNSITKQEIKIQIGDKQPKEVDYNLKESARIRRLVDRKIGYPLSNIIRTQLDFAKGIGRVSAPVLELIAQREDEILGHKAKEYQTIKLELIHKDSEKEITFTMKEKFFEAQKDYLQIVTDDLDDIKRGKNNFTIKLIDSDESYLSAPKLFTTTNIQKEASKELKIKPHQTMNILQKLFENGYITYHRTDSFRIDENKQTELIQYLSKSEDYENDYIEFEPKTNPKTKGQDGHEAIRPTHFEDDFKPSKLDFENEKEKSIYELIWNRTLAYQLKDKVENKQIITISSGEIVEELTIKEVKDLGWTKYLKAIDDSENEAKDNEIKLTDLAVGQEFKLKNYELKSAVTKAASRYTISTLLSKLESLMIGRPSTISSILRELEDKEYISEQNNFLVLNPNGREIINFLRASCSWVVDIEASKILEDKLDSIKDGLVQPDAIYNEFEELITQIETKFKNDLENYKPTNKPTEKMINFAKELNNGEPLSDEILNDFETCKEFINKQKEIAFSKPTSKMINFAKSLNDGNDLPNEVLENIEACKKFIDDKKNSNSKDTDIVCFNCKKGHIQESDKFYTCSTKNCFSIKKENFKRFEANLKCKITDKDIKDLLTNKTTTNKIDFTSKKGNHYEANIMIDKHPKYGWNLSLDDNN